MSLQILKKETFLKMLENSIGSKIFNSLLAVDENGAIKDILNDAEFSCAFFVSNILTLFEFLPRPRATVKSLREELLTKNNLTVIPEIASIEPGDIIFWENKKHEDGTETEHVGFALNNSEAVSTSFKERCVARHDITYGKSESGTPNRPITLIIRPTFQSI